MIVVDKENRKQGNGTNAMEALIGFADEYGKRITLTPDVQNSIRGTTSKTRLVKFYKRFGFVENKGKNADYEINPGMYRTPQANQKGDITQTPAFKKWFKNSKVSR